MTKTCKKCGIEKELSYFTKRKEYKDGYSTTCKVCRNKRKVELYNRDGSNSKIKAKKYYKKNKKKLLKYTYEYLKYRRKNNPFYGLKDTIRVAITNSIRKRGYRKSSRTYEILGCSFEEFKLHIESKFEPWMTWENRGLYNGEFNYGWDIDHIIPISSANSEEELIKLNHYTNLQPLCSKVNRDIKKAKLI